MMNLDVEGARLVLTARKHTDDENREPEHLVDGKYRPYGEQERWAHVEPSILAEVVAEHGSLEAADRAYEAEDGKQYDAWKRGDWWHVGVRVGAALHVRLTGAAKDLVFEDFESESIWGIESNSEAEYFVESAEEMAAELRHRLVTEYALPQALVDAAELVLELEKERTL